MPLIVATEEFQTKRLLPTTFVVTATSLFAV